MNVTMLCPATGNKTTKVNGRTYAGVLGTPQDVLQCDAAELTANGWVTGAEDGTYTTATRPTTGLYAGMKILDSTLAYVVVYDGASWRNPSSGASV